MCSVLCVWFSHSLIRGWSELYEVEALTDCCVDMLVEYLWSKGSKSSERFQKGRLLQIPFMPRKEYKPCPKNLFFEGIKVS